MSSTMELKNESLVETTNKATREALVLIQSAKVDASEPSKKPKDSKSEKLKGNKSNDGSKETKLQNLDKEKKKKKKKAQWVPLENLPPQGRPQFQGSNQTRRSFRKRGDNFNDKGSQSYENSPQKRSPLGETPPIQVEDSQRSNQTFQQSHTDGQDDGQDDGQVPQGSSFPTQGQSERRGRPNTGRSAGGRSRGRGAGGYRYYRPYDQKYYQPKIDPQTLQDMILKQVEYYFSTDNLCKDIYLRKHMDDEGWIHISLIAEFNKVKLLTNDTALILDALVTSELLEVKDEHIRRKNDWKLWLFPKVGLPQL